MKIRTIHLVLVGLLAFSGILAFSAIESYTSPYLEVSEVSGDFEHQRGREIQVMGLVSNNSIQIIDTSLHFSMEDESSAISVVYHGAMPQNFREGIQAVVAGRLTNPGQIEASTILTKCPSKYERVESSAAVDPIFILAMLIIGGAASYLIYGTFSRRRVS
jgi:cytochrome c-type biogenesis protein CcmE